MVFDGRGFLLGGGTQIITTPEGAKAEIQKAVDTARGGGGGGGTPTSTPTATATAIEVKEEPKVTQYTQSELREGVSIRSGSGRGVIVGSGRDAVGHYGNAYIKELGITANQYRKQLDAQARKEFNIPTGKAVSYTSEEIFVKPQRTPTKEGDYFHKSPKAETTGVIHASSISDYKAGYKQPFMTSLKQSVGNILNPATYKESEADKKLRLASIGSEGGTIRRTTAWEKIIEPFKYSGKLEADEPATQTSFGSVNILEPTTKGGQEKERVIVKLAETGQADTTQLSRLYGETSSYKTAKNIPATAETGLLIGSAFIPGGQLAVGTYFLGTGVKKGMDISQAEKEGVKVSPFEKVDIGLRLSFGVGGVVSSIGNIERNIISEELKQLSKSKMKYKSYNYGDGDVSLIGIKGTQQYGGLTREFNIVGKAIKDKKITFIPLGEGSVTTKGTLGWNIARGKQGSQVLDVQAFQLGTKSIPLGNINKYSFATSKTQVVPQSQIGIVYSKEELSNLKRFGTKLGKSLKIGGETEPAYSFSVSKKYGKTSSGDDIFATASGEFEIKDRAFIQLNEQFGLTKQKSLDKGLGLSGLEKGESSFIKRGSLPADKRTPLSKTFGIQVLSKTQGKLNLDLVAKETGKKLQTILPQRTSAVSSAFTGLGLYERTTQATRQQQESSVTPALSSKTSPALSSKTQTRSLSILATAQSPGVTTKQTERTITKTRTSTKQLSKTMQKMSSLFGTTPSSSSKLSSLSPLAVPPFTPIKAGTSSKSKTQTAKATDKKGYTPQIKESGKWKNINKKSYTKEQALALARFVVDNSLSARGRIISSRKKASSSSLRKVSGNKFRSYRKVKGKRVLLKNSGFIEKRKHRLDTSSEVNKINLARLKKKNVFKNYVKPKRKRSKL